MAIADADAVPAVRRRIYRRPIVGCVALSPYAISREAMKLAAKSQLSGGTTFSPTRTTREVQAVTSVRKAAGRTSRRLIIGAVTDTADQRRSGLHSRPALSLARVTESKAGSFPWGFDPRCAGVPSTLRSQPE